VKDFDQDAIESRQHLYRQISELIWSPDRVQDLVESPAASLG
jgi:hypothetical protein